MAAPSTIDMAATASAIVGLLAAALPAPLTLGDTLRLPLRTTTTPIPTDAVSLPTPPALRADAHVTTQPDIEHAYGSLLAQCQLRKRLHDRIVTLLDSGKASKKLATALARWQQVQNDAAATEEALAFVDQWLVRESPFEPAVAAVTELSSALLKRSLWLTAADGALGGTADVAAIHNVLASGENINVIVFCSDGAAQAPGTSGSVMPRRDIGLYALNYGGAYVASCSPAAGEDAARQFVAAVKEAELFAGPAVVLVHVPAQAVAVESEASGTAVAGVGDAAVVTEPATADASVSPAHAPLPVLPALDAPAEAAARAIPALRAAHASVQSGAWPLFRFHPTAGDSETASTGFTIDSHQLRADLAEFIGRESHLALLARSVPTLPEALTASVEAEMVARTAAMEGMLQAAYAALVAGLDLPPLVVLFGSDGGNAENVAKRVVAEAKKRGFADVTLMAMDAYSLAKLAATPLAVFVVSTAGQGEFPMNARNFWKALSAAVAVAPSASDGEGGAASAFALPHLRFAVFGLGDSNYWPKKEQRIYFNKPSVDLEVALHKAGATRVAPRGSGDDQDVGGFLSGFKAWIPSLWAALGVGTVVAEEDASGKVRNPEDIKKTSRFLRGTIAEGLADTSTGALAYEDTLLTKFHGIYQQDDRDARADRKRMGQEPAYSFMVRVRIPGGVASPAQYLAMDDVADRFGNGTIRATTRQAIQFHGIIKGVLKPSIQAINRVLMDTLAACGDVNRNVMCTPAPHSSKLHAAAQDFTARLSDHLTPRTSAYHEIWLEDKLVRGGTVDMEPIYGPTYLPRKFKIAVAIPPSNDVDVYAHDLSFVAIADKATGELAGFTITIGGGMGMTHGNAKTYPRTADELCFATPDAAIAVAEAVVTVQRDWGDRTNRKHARLKYTVDDRGVDAFRAEVQKRVGFPLEPPRAFRFVSNGDRYGWTDAGDDRANYTLFIQNGRIVDGRAPSTYRLKSGLKFLARSGLVPEFRFTPNQNIILARVPGSQRAAVDSVLAEYGIANAALTGLRLNSMACVALPTCGLALAESERYLPSLIDRLDAVVDAAGLHDDAITIRMTGCPNGCARPFVAEIGFVGRSPGIYNLYLGAGFAGQRLSKLYREGVDEDTIVGVLDPLIRRYALERFVGAAWATAYADSKLPNAARMAAGAAEPFGEWLIRAGVVKPTTAGKTFHDDLPPEMSSGLVPAPSLADNPAIAAGKAARRGGEASIPE